MFNEFKEKIQATEKRKKELDVMINNFKQAEKNLPLLKVGNCFKNKNKGNREVFYKILYVDDSGLGYHLVICESFSFTDLQIYKKQNGLFETKRFSRQKIFMNVDFAINFLETLNHLVLISANHYEEMKKEIIDIFIKSKIFLNPPS